MRDRVPLAAERRREALFTSFRCIRDHRDSRITTSILLFQRMRSLVSPHKSHIRLISETGTLTGKVILKTRRLAPDDKGSLPCHRASPFPH